MLPVTTMISKTGSKRSFTLIELLLVLMVIGILAGVSAPALRTSVRNAGFKAFIAKLYLFLDYARSRSTLKNVVLAVNFGDDTKTIFLKEQDDVVNRIAVPDDIVVQSKDRQVLFYPDGTSQQFQLLVQAGDRQKSVILSRGFDGKIKIENYGAAE